MRFKWVVLLTMVFVSLGIAAVVLFPVQVKVSSSHPIEKLSLKTGLPLRLIFSIGSRARNKDLRPKVISVILSDKVRDGYAVKEKGILLMGSTFISVEEGVVIDYVWISEELLRAEDIDQLLTAYILSSWDKNIKGNGRDTTISMAEVTDSQWVKILKFWRGSLIHVYK